jgi:hypothetical protein
MGMVDSHPQREDEEIRGTVAKKMSFNVERVVRHPRNRYHGQCVQSHQRVTLGLIASLRI